MQPQMSFEPLTPTAFLRRSAAVFADRIAVIYNGRIMGEFDAFEVDQEKIGLLMAGVEEDDRS